MCRKKRGGTAYTSFRQPLAWALGFQGEIVGLYKWFFKKMTGIELVDPDPNFVPERNDAEEYLDQDPNWPKLVEGKFYLIDSSGDDEHEFYWVIGELELPDFKKSILLEFKDGVLIESELNKKEEFPEQIKVWVNPAVHEYYQVNKIEET